jgi:putative sugar O-methyltransferase
MKPQNHELFLDILEIPLKVLTRVKNLRAKYLTRVGSKSDSERTSYADFVQKVTTQDKKFLKFRKNYAYRQILEHVSFGQGLEYFERVQIYNGNFEHLDDFLTSSAGIGSPREFEYPGIGLVSPTTLRYLAVASEINYVFDFDKPLLLVEVGIGFGGQFAALSQLLEIDEYWTYDLPEVQKLASRYCSELAHLLQPLQIKHQNIYLIDEKTHDLFISNFAFSELPRETQIEYLHKVARNSKRGYITMNSGRTNFTGRSTGKITLEEIQIILPEIEVFAETPNTGPDNYLILWGHDRKPL